ncbi:glycerate dehydrogenase [Burkholderia sp. SRS-W-2-2016]|uniref:D-2-hydroxyacid dehydrogenase n=1 Tax=Burkholderia sp. SRS-W-2-2016 TaxID=1926878 RepID=UPI00094B215A|nr:D-2-hydroxyacid dehydrogenase [Burkholderia sp. SRS-W-2-2016]OLL29203.1 glycerate dehydrogenase [Burkholderia sp. SRS-W-2-2016]
MKTIVVLDRATLPANLPQFSFAHQWVEYAFTEPGQVVERCRDAQIVITNKVPLTREALLQLRELKLVGVPAAGVNHLHLATCSERGIPVVACPGYSTLSVPEHAFALMMALRRNLVPYWRDVHAGGWSGSPTFFAELHPVSDLFGSTLGIVGAGHGGKRMAQLAEAFGMRVLFAERRNAATVRPGYTAFTEVLREADIISLHCPLTDDTRRLFALPEFEQMKRTASLVNTARGGIVDESALIEALDRKLIANAALDVLEEEPPSAAHPLLCNPRADLIVTPHVAWRTDVAMTRLLTQLEQGIEQHFARGA